MKADIITIGDELLIGQVVDTNSAWMAEKLNQAGIELYEILSVHDEPDHIKNALTYALSHADVVLTTGGLGPTKDDITKNVLCDYFHTSLVPDEQVKKHIYELYKDRPQVLNRLTDTQWLVPKDAIILPNAVGTAPIMLWLQDGKLIYNLPGVPREMKVAMEQQVVPDILKRFPTGEENIIHKTLIVSGIPESALAIILEEWENTLPALGLHLAYLPVPEERRIRLRLSAYGTCSNEQFDEQFEKLHKIICTSQINIVPLQSE